MTPAEAVLDRPTTTSMAPDRSLIQRRDALRQANQIRVARAQFKRDIAAGRASAIAALLEPPAELRTMKVVDLLLAMPKVGRVKAQKALTQTRCSLSKTLDGLSDRQRRELVAVLRSYPAVRRAS